VRGQRLRKPLTSHPEPDFIMKPEIKYLVIVCLLGFCGMGFAGDLNTLKKLIGTQDSLLVADSQGQILFAQNADKKLIPASTLKILTSLTALHYLGTDFRFVTEFYTDRDSNLKIKGYGDPVLISEVVAEIAETLSTKLGTFNNLVLDNSYFDPAPIPGVTVTLNPYDAPNGALCVNFNTVFFKREPDGSYSSAEPQTPLLPFALKKIAGYGLKQDRVILSQEQDEITLYAGAMFQYFLKQQGILSEGGIRLGKVDKTDKLIFRYLSKFSLQDVIARLLEYSNNFIANQTLLAIGAKVYGAPATLEKGVQAALSYAADVLKLKDIRLAEGSGISRENRISAKDLMVCLEAFEPYHSLMRHQGREFFKTGSLNGVKTRAGYIDDGTGGMYRFAVMLNTPGKSTDAVMSRLLNALP